MFVVKSVRQHCIRGRGVLILGSASHGTFFRKHRNPENGCATTGTTAAANSYLSGAVAGNGNLDGTITPAHTSPKCSPRPILEACLGAPESWNQKVWHQRVLGRKCGRGEGLILGTGVCKNKYQLKHVILMKFPPHPHIQS